MIFKNKYKSFWSWFMANSEELFINTDNNAKILDKLHNELNKINNNLTFEFGQTNNEKREFIISADGIRESFVFVEKLFSSKPELEKWDIKKFRQRGDITNSITINGITLFPKNVKYLLFLHENKIGLYLFIYDFNKNKETYTNLAYILLDNILGEYDVETKMGGILFKDYNTEYFEQSKSIESFRKEFDLMWSEIEK